ncbi:transposase [bacterium]|nr:transposase [bacterium]
MNPAYWGAVLKFLPAVPMVFDLFHIVKMVNNEIDQLRREAQAQLDVIEGNVLKGSRYLLLSNYADLDEYNRRRLRELFRINHPLITMYVMKEQLLLLWKLPDRERGEQVLDRLGERRYEFRRKSFDQAGENTVGAQTGILNYFDHRITTGKVEGQTTRSRP